MNTGRSRKEAEPPSLCRSGRSLGYGCPDVTAVIRSRRGNCSLAQTITQPTHTESRWCYISVSVRRIKTYDALFCMPKRDNGVVVPGEIPCTWRNSSGGKMSWEGVDLGDWYLPLGSGNGYCLVGTIGAVVADYTCGSANAATRLLA